MAQGLGELRARVGLRTRCRGAGRSRSPRSRTRSPGHRSFRGSSGTGTTSSGCTPSRATEQPAGWQTTSAFIRAWTLPPLCSSAVMTMAATSPRGRYQNRGSGSAVEGRRGQDVGQEPLLLVGLRDLDLRSGRRSPAVGRQRPRRRTGRWRGRDRCPSRFWLVQRGCPAGSARSTQPGRR